MDNIKDKNIKTSKNTKEPILNIPKEHKIEKDHKKGNRKIKINKPIKKLNLKLIFD